MTAVSKHCAERRDLRSSAPKFLEALSMRILVTGGAGFIGSHVVDTYVAAGHEVTVVDDLSSGKKRQLNPAARFVRADIRDERLERVFKKGRFDIVNHHAAQMDVRRSVEDPRFDADVNVLGLLNVLQLARKHGVRKMILAASGGTYYGECVRPARESDPPRPLSPYGITKLAGEHYLRAYEALHGIDFTILRYGNVYGPRQDPHGEAGVVAIFCNRLLAGQPLLVFGDGRQQRDYVFVADVARANLAALRRGKCEAVNIGTGRASSVNMLFESLRRAHGGGIREFRPPRPGELFRSCLDIRHASAVLGWRPRVALDEGLRRTYRFIASGAAR
jgi:UDP-glucose 4-epimerase